MSSYLKRWISTQLLFPTDKWMNEDHIRNKFHMSPQDPCADFIAHLPECPYIVGEEKETSDIPKAIEQLRRTVVHLIHQGLIVSECILVCNSLGKFRNLGRKQGSLYNKTTDKYVIIGTNLKITVKYISEISSSQKKK